MSQILHLLLCAALERAPSLKFPPDEQNLLLGAVYGLLKGSTLLLKCKIGFELCLALHCKWGATQNSQLSQKQLLWLLQ